LLLLLLLLLLLRGAAAAAADSAAEDAGLLQLVPPVLQALPLGPEHEPEVGVAVPSAAEGVAFAAAGEQKDQHCALRAAAAFGADHVAGGGPRLLPRGEAEAGPRQRVAQVYDDAAHAVQR